MERPAALRQLRHQGGRGRHRQAPGVGGRERVLFTTHTAAYDSKNRHGLPKSCLQPSTPSPRCSMSTLPTPAGPAARNPGRAPRRSVHGPRGQVHAFLVRAGQIKADGTWADVPDDCAAGPCKTPPVSSMPWRRYQRRQEVPNEPAPLRPPKADSLRLLQSDPIPGRQRDAARSLDALFRVARPGLPGPRSRSSPPTADGDCPLNGRTPRPAPWLAAPPSSRRRRLPRESRDRESRHRGRDPARRLAHADLKTGRKRNSASRWRPTRSD